MKLFQRFCISVSFVLLPLLANAGEELNSIFTNITTSPQAIPHRASIIFIQCEGLGYGDLSCYGQTKFQTPNIDKLAADGICFTNYVAVENSVISRASLMLGKNPDHLPQASNPLLPLSSSDVSVAQVLQKAGYRTAMIGDWILGNENSSGSPWNKGFETFAGYFDTRDAENFYADYIYRYQPHAVFDEKNKTLLTANRRETLLRNSGGKHEQFIPDVLTTAAGNFIRINHPDTANHFRPFFLQLNYKLPHVIDLPTDAPYSGETWPQAEKKKAAAISRLDGYVGQIRSQLEKYNMTNNVVVFFSSDTISTRGNGTNPSFFKSNISTNDFRVPMIAYWHDKIDPQQVSGLKWTAKDFLPTAAAIAYTQSPTNIDGVSILPELIGGKSPAPLP